mgnify:CR=1 FL=1
MNIISWKPKPKVLVNDIDSVLDSFFQNDWSFEKRKNHDGNWIPSVDISENEIQLGAIPRDYFFKYLARIVDTNATKMYFSNFTAPVRAIP